MTAQKPSKPQLPPGLALVAPKWRHPWARMAHVAPKNKEVMLTLCGRVRPGARISDLGSLELCERCAARLLAYGVH
jgi:hypothetical protein